jgi:hypothetical protein
MDVVEEMGGRDTTANLEIRYTATAMDHVIIRKHTAPDTAGKKGFVGWLNPCEFTSISLNSVEEFVSSLYWAEIERKFPYIGIFSVNITRTQILRQNSNLWK